MASPFYSSYWNQPTEPRYSPSPIPLKRRPEAPSPKVISIPVHFVDSKNNRVSSGTDRSERALRIQKVFRGFLVRTSVNRIVKIKNQVEEMERRIAKTETVELIRRDSKERLRINETLMALLFKLDSVRGIDSGVRELRKGVIKKAIALQEKVDALVMLPLQLSPEEQEAAVDSGDIVDSIKSDGGETVDGPAAAAAAAISADSMPIEEATAATSNDNMPIENSPVAISMDNMPIENVIDSMDHSQDVSEQGNCVVKEVVEDCNTMNSKTGMQKHDQEMDDCSKGVQQQQQQQQAEEEEDTGGEVTMGYNDKTVSEEAGEKRSNEELQTQMIRMMSELVEKNELQTRMINSLTHRVGQLEKAFLCDKLRRTNKKKKRLHDAAADAKHH